ncbi:DUF2845 domain-containing protein [Geobacter pelophilus]|uniref:DUF2845 domain-containing protein n=1 Tax=Geoanaerobacter pelophilus TaxID=60036 RepID=A0AAW4LES0_9BACT|nr:DUF2845 domain-containing protein [Geoanaerobacter pelophilus]MBT0666504.1 DUF2845 domain-containing protein [Geoanaerobacter pelophilus]
MTRLYTLITTVGLLTLAIPPALADDRDTLRCGAAIISIGSTAGEVLNKCGEPASGSQREAVTINGNRQYRTIITNDIEDWIFNFGPNQFQYQITLKNGRVRHIQSLGKGY